LVKNTESPSNLVVEPFDGRLLRYQMQSAARHILHDHRIRICMRHQIDKYGNVDIYKHRSTSKAFYGGLMQCGSSWVCPLCAGKISERRRQELKHAFKIYSNDGGYLTMMTLTFSHSKWDKLSDLIKKLTEAVGKFRSGRNYDNLRKKLKIDGSVRALEITYGANGWHPHIHIVNFHRTEIEPYEYMEYEDDFYYLWDIALGKVGLSGTREHALKLDDASKADEYISKYGQIYDWSAEDEMTKANTKKGKQESLTPFDMLRRVIEDGDLEYTDQYREYASAIKRKTQLYWSPGLKKRFDIEDKTDEDIVVEKVEEADLLGTLRFYEWKYIIRAEKRHELLSMVEQHGFVKTREILGLHKLSHIEDIKKDTAIDSALR